MLINSSLINTVTNWSTRIFGDVIYSILTSSNKIFNQIHLCQYRQVRLNKEIRIKCYAAQRVHPEHDRVSVEARSYLV